MRSEDVRSKVLLSMLGSADASTVSQIGVDFGTKGAMATLRRPSGRVLIEINKKAGLRLLTKVDEKGVVNPGRFAPVVGEGVSAMVNVATVRMVGTYAKRNIPVLS